MDVAALPYKIGQFIDGAWKEFKHSNTYCCDSNREDLIRIGAKNPYLLFIQLLERLKEPLQILVVLHTPKEESDAGRLISGDLTRNAVAQFLARYRAAFDRDARADLWVISSSDHLKLGWEKHDFVFSSKDIEGLFHLLGANGICQGEVELPFPHTHHYHDEFDLDFQAMLEHCSWVRSDLEPGDGD